MTRESIHQRVDQALEKARWRGLEIRGLYLDAADYKAFAKAETARWRKASGSKAKLWPLSYQNILILGSGCVLVKEAQRSRVYAKGGECIDVPKRLSAKVALAA